MSALFPFCAKNGRRSVSAFDVELPPTPLASIVNGMLTRIFSNESDPEVVKKILADAEAKLAAKIHPDPYICTLSLTWMKKDADSQ
jgi:hypothetical protein